MSRLCKNYELKSLDVVLNFICRQQLRERTNWFSDFALMLEAPGASRLKRLAGDITVALGWGSWGLLSCPCQELG